LFQCFCFSIDLIVTPPEESPDPAQGGRNLLGTKMPIDRSHASEQIKLLVWSGLRSQKESRRIVLDDCFRPEEVTEADATWVGEEVARAWSAKLEEEKPWPALTDWDKLDAAFASLRAGGIIALHQAGYEPSDGPPMVAEEYHARGAERSGLVGFCFYDWQSIERAIKGYGVWLACGDIAGDPQRGAEIARRVVAAVEGAGLRTTWDGTIDGSIWVDMRWQKRSPMLRAELESGAITDDPSEGVLLELLSGIERGDEAFLVLERLSDASGQTYMQVRRLKGGSYRVEHREGSADRHFQATAASMREARAVLADWAREAPGWRQALGWEKMELY
jgi:hypothetical protein